MAFVVTNGTDGDRILSIGTGDPAAAARDAMAGHGSVDPANGQSVLVRPGESATIVRAFAPGETIISWLPVDHAAHGFAVTVETSGS